jgi:sulfotransferase family protein
MLRKLLARQPDGKDPAQPVLVVSGLPRSGTSMMMKMLAEGGVPAMVDSIRGADDDNPNGYFEFEPVKQLAEGQHQWLADAAGKVVKVISALLEYLPENRRYKIIFMEREIREVLSSQQKMLSHRREEAKFSDDEMEEKFREHLKATKYWLARQPNMDVLYVDYNKMLSDPEDYCRAIAGFVGLPLDIAKMRSVPNERLYRNRAANPPSPVQGLTT